MESRALIFWSAAAAGTFVAVLAVLAGMLALRRVSVKGGLSFAPLLFGGVLIGAIPICFIMCALASQYARQMGGSAQLGSGSASGYTLHSSNLERHVTGQVWRTVLFAEYLAHVAMFWMVIGIAAVMLYGKFGTRKGVQQRNGPP
jgi:hypothetical protein